jgi:hypothetical protein
LIHHWQHRTGDRLSGGFVGYCTILVGLISYLAAPAVGVAGEEASAGAPSWQLGVRSTAYAFQTESMDGTEDHLRTFNVVSGSATGLAGGRLLVRGAGRFAGNPALERPGFARSRLYNGYLEARLGSGLKARAGRQFIQSGVTSLSLDGARLEYRRARGLDVSAYAGARSPLTREFALGEFDQDAAAGGRVAFRPHRHWRLGASAAYRERRGAVASRPVGCEVTSSALPHTRVFGRAAYDLETRRWSRVQAQARWRGSPRTPVVTVQYVDRHPTVDAVSWFSRFTGVKRVRLLRGSLRWEAATGFGAETEFAGTYVDTRRSSRIGLAALVPGGRVGYSVRLGDAGEESRFYGEIARRVAPWLRLEAEGSVLTYALLEDAPAEFERDLTTLAVRARADLRRGLRAVAEVQSLENPFFAKDVRVLVGVDLALARGNSRFGLDRGGWLR